MLYCYLIKAFFTFLLTIFHFVINKIFVLLFTIFLAHISYTWNRSTCKSLATAGFVLLLHMYELTENNTVVITEVLGRDFSFCYNIKLFSLKA